MQVTRLRSAPFEVNVHVVREGDRALIVDATSGLDWATFAPRLTDALRGARVETLYLTHVHVDHVGGAAKVRALAGEPKVLMHEGEAFVVEKGDATLTGGALFGVPQEPCPVTTVREGDVVELGARRFEVMLTPGHSPAHTVLWESESRSLFAGDLVFAQGSFGRVDLPGGDARAMLKSLERVAALDAKDLYAGHLEHVEGNAREAILESLDNARLMLS